MLSSVDIVCFSHLRWDFVYQRPQHLMSRFAANRRVFFVEEAIMTEGGNRLGVTLRPCGATVLVPQLRHFLADDEPAPIQRRLLSAYFAAEQIERPIVWYYTPMALAFSDPTAASVVVYDCMDELSAFLGAPPRMAAYERELFGVADLVFTGGRSLWEAKRRCHPRVYAFPSSVDVDHFRRARRAAPFRTGRALCVGYMGVVDERMDIALVAQLAKARPEWSIKILGPVVKIDPSALPQLPNITYHGLISYADLPDHLSRWDVAIIPFVRNRLTQYVSPTKLLEYFAAGRPVVSTPLPDVVDPYGTAGHVHIADEPSAFVSAIQHAAASDRGVLIRGFDSVLATTSWDRTWQAMTALLEDTLRDRTSCRQPLTRCR